jgi:hypothetical protein
LRASAPEIRWKDAATLLDDRVLRDDFTEILTLPAYRLLDG